MHIVAPRSPQLELWPPIAPHLASARTAPADLENLEYSGISLNRENSGNSVQPQGKIVTKYF